MATKRKLTSKSTETSSNKQQKKQDDEPQQQDQNQQVDEEIEEEIEEEEEVEEEEEDEQEEEQEEDEEDEEQEEQDEDDDDEEPIQNLLEPLTKDMLIGLLSKAAGSHPDVAKTIKKLADEDPVHRKIFVHGLGWDTTADTLRSVFSQYGDIEDCKAVIDKNSGKSKGYGFILFKSRAGARKALREPQKKIGNRMTSCQLAAMGATTTGTAMSGGAGSVGAGVGPVSEYTQRKIYVSNVSPELDPRKLTEYFAKFGEIEEGPLGLDKHTGKPKGFCLFVYRSVESARKALEEPHKPFDGHVLHCQKAIDGPKHGKQGGGGGGGGAGGGGFGRGQQYGRNDGNPNVAGAIGGPPATGAGLMGQSVGGVPFGQTQGFNPALGQALTALLATQGAGLGLNNLLGTLGGGIGAPGAGAGYGTPGVYGAPAVPGAGMNHGGVLGGYGSQGGLQAAYPNQQMGQGGSARPQHGHMGGAAPYSGH